MNRGIRFSTIAIDGLDSVFYCWCRVKSSVEGIEEFFKPCRPQDFWLFTNEEKKYTMFISRYIKPAGYITVSLRSRELFRWGVFEIRSKLPKIAGGPMLWFGFELDDLFGGGVVHFMWNCDRGVLAAFAGGFSSRVEMDLTRYLPSDASIDPHLYRIIHRRGLALWYIDDRLRAMAILGCGTYRDSSILYDKKPYTIGFTRDAPSAALPILLDIDGGDTDKAFEWPDLHPWDLRVSEGDSNTSIYLDLFIEDSNNTLRNYSTEGEIVSAPFPGTLDWKEILFAVDGRGLLTIESFTNGQWFEYRTVEISEKRLYSIPIQDKSFMNRIVFKSNIPARIIEAQAVLR
ncbi:MAG: hypothetical protein N3D82_05080 [Ignisphaera sp.]|nr:hypothetical protein [Ignisphaera sp.]MCX8168381.1 hypothetical protein [Ignisphaera sp.]MDW8085787.1 hypothetical protein [Ignisphaera sp.]